MKLLSIGELTQNYLIEARVEGIWSFLPSFNALRYTIIEFWGVGTYSLDGGVFRKGNYTNTIIQVHAARLKDKILCQKIWDARANQAEDTIRAIRNNMRIYRSLGKEEKAKRIIDKCVFMFKSKWERSEKLLETFV